MSLLKVDFGPELDPTFFHGMINSVFSELLHCYASLIDSQAAYISPIKVTGLRNLLLFSQKDKVLMELWEALLDSDNGSSNMVQRVPIPCQHLCPEHISSIDVRLDSVNHVDCQQA